MASGPDKAMACRYCQTTRVWRAWRKAYVFVWALDCQSQEEGARNIDFILILRFEISGVGEPLDSWVVRIWPERERAPHVVASSACRGQADPSSVPSVG